MNFNLQQTWNDLLTQYGLDDAQGRWIVAGAIFVLTFLIVYLIRSLISWRVSRLAERSSSVWDDATLEALRRTKVWFVVALAAFAASLSLDVFTARAREIINVVMVLLLLIQVGYWGNGLISSGAELYVKRRKQDDAAAAMTVSAIAMIGKIVLLLVLLLVALDNMGIDVTALIAGLGVGGIAVALALQNVLGDLLASLSIVFDKPFVPGDFIIVGDKMGTVQKIGLKTTRLTALSGEQLVFSNTDLLQSRIHNYKKMAERRVVFSVGVTYDTPRDDLKRIPDLLRESVEAQPETRFDRAHFKSFGDSSLVFETVYYVLSPDFNKYMDTQQAINLDIHERFESIAVEFAFPTHTVYLEKPDDGADANI